MAMLINYCIVWLVQESNEAFDVLEAALQQHPFFQRQPSLDDDEVDSAMSAAATAAGVAPSSPLASLAAMLSAVRKDRSSFMDKVADCVQRATPVDQDHQDGEGRACFSMRTTYALRYLAPANWQCTLWAS